MYALHSTCLGFSSFPKCEELTGYCKVPLMTRHFGCMGKRENFNVCSTVSAVDLAAPI